MPCLPSLVPLQLRVCAEAGDLRNAMHVADMLQVRFVAFCIWVDACLA